MITAIVDNETISQLQWVNINCNPLKHPPFNKLNPISTPLTIQIFDKTYLIKHNFLINCEKNVEPLLIYYSQDYLFLCKAAQYGITAVFDIQRNVLLLSDLVYENHFKEVILNFVRLTKKYNLEFTEFTTSTEDIKYTPCTFIGTRQIMHHFMQELPGIQKLCNNTKIQKIYSFFEYYGDHSYILNTEIPIEYITCIDQLFLDTCIQRNFYYKVIESHTTIELIDRIKNNAYKNSVSLDLIYNKCFLFTIRTTKRLLKNQEDFIISSIKTLETIYPGSLYFIDGYTKLHSSWVCDNHPHVERERKIFHKILRALPLLNIKSLIFVDLVTYINTVKSVDFYFAHVGTLQHKIGFLSGARGLIHGGADKLIGDWSNQWYNSSHFGKTVQRFSDECVQYEDKTYNSAYTLDCEKTNVFIKEYLQDLW